jgi:hypothetical protein
MTDDITAADIDVAQYAGETIRLTASITHVLDSPRVIEGEVSSTGKTIAAPHPTREDTTWRLDTATILAGELEVRGSYGVELYTPERFQRTEDANYGPGPQAGTEGASDAADLPTPTHRVGGERVALTDGGSDDDGPDGDDSRADDGAEGRLERSPEATATVQVFMTAGHSRHEAVDTDSERFRIARDLRGFGLDAFEDFDHDPDRAAALAYDALGESVTLPAESFDTVDELLQFVHDTCQGPRTATSMPYDGSETRSLTVGDVILVDGDAWMVARLGFEPVPMAAADLRDDEDDTPEVVTDGGQPRVTTEELPAGTAPDLSSVYVHRSPSGDSGLSDYIFCTFGQRSVGGLSVPGGSVAEWVETQVLQQFDGEDDALDELLPTEAEREAAGDDPVRVGRLHFDRRAGEVVALELDPEAFEAQRGGRSIVTDGGVDIGVGSVIHLPGDRGRIVITGVTESDGTPAATDHGPLYQAEVRTAETAKTVLYGPHNLQAAFDAGAAVRGWEAIDDPADPFWCAGCGYACSSDERHPAPLLDVPVCSWGCKETVEAERRAERLERDRVTDGGFPTATDAEWCQECQRERISCTHREN